MPSFSGKYRYLDPGGAVLKDGSCRLTLEEGLLLLTPQSGPPISCDLGDIDEWIPADYELALKLYTGDAILLYFFGKTFQDLCRELLEAYRKRLVECLLLGDLEEIERFDGQAILHSPNGGFSSRAQIRLYRSNLAVLPDTAAGVSWRFSDIDNVDFDDATYTIGLRRGQERLNLTKLAKRTREFMQRLQEAMTDVSETGARIIRSFFPFLNPAQFQLVAAQFREGRAVPVSSLRSIHPQMEPALLARAVDSNLKGYLDFLGSIAVQGSYYTGYKMLREEEEIDSSAGSDSGGNEKTGSPEEEAGARLPEAAAVSKGEEKNSILHWFFFPLRDCGDPAFAANAIAWEATSRSGRATYLFRLLPEEQAARLRDKTQVPAVIAESARQLNHAIVTLNFRREPIYLGEEALLTQERFHRYAIACRRIPELRRLRSSFLGRALHTSPEAWQKQVQAILAGA